MSSNLPPVLRAALDQMWRDVYAKLRGVIREEVGQSVGGVVHGGRVVGGALPLGSSAETVGTAGAGGAGETVARADHVHGHGTGYLPDAHHAQAHALQATDHSDVAATAPVDGQALLWDAGTAHWAPGAVITEAALRYEPLTNGDWDDPQLVFFEGDVVMVPMEA